MRKAIINVLIAIAGLFLAIAPFTILQPCVMMEGAACNYLAKTAAILGAIIAVLGITGAFLSEKKSTIIHGITVIAVGVAAALSPTIIGACEMREMACRMKTVPGIYITSIAVIVFAIILVITEVLSGRSGEDVR